jgi:hypothetical protein
LKGVESLFFRICKKNRQKERKTFLRRSGNYYLKALVEKVLRPL